MKLVAWGLLSPGLLWRADLASEKLVEREEGGNTSCDYADVDFHALKC